MNSIINVLANDHWIAKVQVIFRFFANYVRFFFRPSFLLFRFEIEFFFNGLYNIFGATTPLKVDVINKSPMSFSMVLHTNNHVFEAFALWLELIYLGWKIWVFLLQRRNDEWHGDTGAEHLSESISGIIWILLNFTLYNILQWSRQFLRWLEHLTPLWYLFSQKSYNKRVIFT